MQYYIGIDLGTSGVKALLMSEDGFIIGTAYRGYDIIKLKVSYAEQDMEHLWEQTVEAIKELVRLYPLEVCNVAGISYSAQMHGLIGLDKNGVPVRNAIIWADQRTEKQIKSIYETIGEDVYKNITGNTLSTGFLLASLLWVRENEQHIYDKIKYVMFPKDYIRYRMCNEIGTDVSDASCGAILDINKKEWAWNCADALKIPSNIFPSIYESTSIVGSITKECAAATGLKEGISVVCGGGDAIMQAIGNGLVEVGGVVLNIGTSAQVVSVVNNDVFDPKFRTNLFWHACKDSRLLVGAHLSGGITLKWLKNQILNIADYDELSRKARTVAAGCEGLVFLPYLSGERMPYHNPNARGMYFGLSLKHENAHMIRATMEGVIYMLRQSFEIMEGIGMRCNRIIASGGGAKDSLLLQMQADIFGREIYINKATEQAGMGAAITAAVATGAYASFEEACNKIVSLSDVIIEPNKKLKADYDKAYAIFSQLYTKNESLFSSE